MVGQGIDSIRIHFNSLFVDERLISQWLLNSEAHCHGSCTPIRLSYHPNITRNITAHNFPFAEWTKKRSNFQGLLLILQRLNNVLYFMNSNKHYPNGESIPNFPNIKILIVDRVCLSAECLALHRGGVAYYAPKVAYTILLAGAPFVFFHKHTLQTLEKAKRIHRAILKPQMLFISKQVILLAPAQVQ